MDCDYDVDLAISHMLQLMEIADGKYINVNCLVISL